MAPSVGPSQRWPSRRSRPIRSSRTQVQSYHEDSSSEDRLDEDADSDSEHLRRLSLSLRPRNPNRMPTSYREESTDDGFEGDPSDDPDAAVPVDAPTHFTYPFSDPVSNRSSTRVPHKRTVKTRSQSKRSKRTGSKQLEPGRPIHKRRKVEDATPFMGSGVIPPWETLPYQILFDIFYSASYPLIDEKDASRTSSVQWLVDVALLCRAFHEPALAALYHSPPLMPAAKAHGLLNLLSKPQEDLSTNYVNKIKELHIDAEMLLLYKSGPSLGYFELSKLIEKTPQLKKLRLYHSNDYVVGLPMLQTSRWSYPDSLFASLSLSSIRLRSWDWNGRFMDTTRLPPLMMEKHLQPTFQNLKKLSILHVTSYDYDSDDYTDDSNEREIVLATALKELPQLQRLEFLECSIVNEHLLPNLPQTLTSLTINNCEEVTALNFSAFLTSHGQHLRELVLNHNRHLSMSFIVGLGQWCQRLERFKMDISIHDRSSYHDVEPHFSELISPSEVPTWPSTLQDIELIQLRNWDDVTANVFFTSLIDAATELHDLRRLVISAILQIGWRDRASFRERWIGRLERTFLRRSAPPGPTLRSNPSALQPGPGSITGTTATDDMLHHSDAPRSGPSTPSKRKSARLAQRKLSEVEDNVDLSPSDRVAAEGEDDQKPLPVQGMCDVVMVRIDNQRPSDTQFNEEDFLDEEVSGDEDWNGVDLDAGDMSHAW
ncbi:hypothetical protein BDV25DRAFT_67559 [Aspergillus avenaceus]|uniref:F-box domain-containing protein n=1 Tax=Aspergillus avenaceus TaxID=36643 RepID=A0A5N6U1Z7_ASPAV|nr:hypothetical protein BDV25DRAFT_67559 [Aspergillus avenaceus]